MALCAGFLAGFADHVQPPVTIVNPDFPGDAPNGIQLVTDSSIPSPSNLGIELGHVSFVARFMGEVGEPDPFYFLSQSADLPSQLAQSTASDSRSLPWPPPRFSSPVRSSSGTLLPAPPPSACSSPSSSLERTRPSASWATRSFRLLSPILPSSGSRLPSRSSPWTSFFLARSTISSQACAFLLPSSSQT